MKRYDTKYVRCIILILVLSCPAPLMAPDIPYLSPSSVIVSSDKALLIVAESKAKRPPAS